MMDKINKNMAKKLIERLTREYLDYEGLISIELIEFTKISEKTFGSAGFDIWLSGMKEFKLITDRITEFFKDELTFMEAHNLDVRTDIRTIMPWNDGIHVGGFTLFTPRNIE